MDLENIASNIQDQIVFHMINDEKFYRKATLCKVEPDHFVGDIRRMVASYLFEFINEFGNPPGGAIYTYISNRVNASRRRDKETLLSELDDYFLNLIKVSKGDPAPSNYLESVLEDFAEKQILKKILDEAFARAEMIDTNPKEIKDVIQAGMAELNLVEQRQQLGKFGEESYQQIRAIASKKVLTKFNIPHIDNYLGGGFKPGQLGAIQAYTNRGKSWAIVHLAKHAVRRGTDTLVIITEIDYEAFYERLLMSFNGMTSQQLSDNGYDPEKHKSGIRKKARILTLKETEATLRVDMLPAWIEAYTNQQGKPPKLILIDSADDLMPPVDYKGSMEKYDRLANIYTYLKNFGLNTRMCIITTSQSQRRGETKQWLTSGTMSESIAKSQKLHIGVSINAREIEAAKGYSRLYLFKNTYGPVGAKCWVKNDFSRGLFYTKYGEYTEESYKNMLVTQEGVSIG